MSNKQQQTAKTPIRHSTTPGSTPNNGFPPYPNVQPPPTYSSMITSPRQQQYQNPMQPPPYLSSSPKTNIPFSTPIPIMNPQNPHIRTGSSGGSGSYGVSPTTAGMNPLFSHNLSTSPLMAPQFMHPHFAQQPTARPPQGIPAIGQSPPSGSGFPPPFFTSSITTPPRQAVSSMPSMTPQPQSTAPFFSPPKQQPQAASAPTTPIILQRQHNLLPPSAVPSPAQSVSASTSSSVQSSPSSNASAIVGSPGQQQQQFQNRYYFPGAASLHDQLDKRVFILLRGGKKLVGILRSFDQYANLVLEDTVERIVVNELFGDLPLGLYIVRGENVVLMGEIDEEQEEQLNSERMQMVSLQTILELQKKEREAREEKIKEQKKALSAKGMTLEIEDTFG